ITVRSDALHDGNTKSCGCFALDKSRSTGHANKLHGATVGYRPTKEYRTWQNIKKRCTVPTNPAYPNYGGRGIYICDQWINDFTQFLSDMGKCPPDHSIERIDNDGPYSPDNCKWANRAEQSRNTRRNIWIDYEGRRWLMADLIRAYNLKRVKFQKLYRT